MVVARIWTFDVKPGRMASCMEWIAENIREPRRLDDSDLLIRVFRRSVAGDGTGKIDAVAKYENTGRRVPRPTVSTRNRITSGSSHMARQPMPRHR
ncbi:MAG: hypothetical protein R2849_06935 [Thermomicrobiales bacterium]